MVIFLRQNRLMLYLCEDDYRKIRVPEAVYRLDSEPSRIAYIILV